MSVASHILVVEDNLTTAKTLNLFLQSAGYEVLCVETGDEAIEAFSRETFDLVLLDIMLPGQDGLSVCREIRRSSQIPVVMLTAKSSEDDIVFGLENGANDYVCKPFSSKELLARIRTCLRIWSASKLISDAGLSFQGSSFQESSLQKSLLQGGTAQKSNLILGKICLNEAQHLVTLNDETIKLTKSEFAILHVMLKQIGRVFTREQLINAALGDDYEGVDRTIDTYIWSLRKKLKEPKGCPRYLHSEMGIGYRLQDAFVMENLNND